jgi:hypothetical protein
MDGNYGDRDGYCDVGAEWHLDFYKAPDHFAFDFLTRLGH